MRSRALEAWRLVREVDLESIRRDADRPFQVLVAANARGDAQELARLLGGGEAHPWLLAREPRDAHREAGSGMLDAAVAVCRGPDLEGELASVRAVLREARVPLVTVALAGGRGASVPRAGEAGRVTAGGLEEALPDLAEALLAAVPPALRVALARQLPPLRHAAVAQLVDDTARANAMYALTTAVAESVPLLGAPLNLADVVVLTKNQLVMSYRIALASGRKGAPRDLMGEVIGVIGGGFLFRQAGRQLVGLLPLAGLALKPAVAYAGTLAIGKAVAAWAGRGQRVTRRTVGRLYREAWAQGRKVARGLLADRRGR